MGDMFEHPSASITKMLLIGESGTGKTGALASLAAAGYKVHIIDLDNGLDILRNLVTAPKSTYKSAATPGQLTYVTLTEPMKNMGGRAVPAKAIAWEETIKLLERWVEYKTDASGKPLLEDGKPIILRDLGKITSWTTNDILVIDSLTMLATAAFNFDWKLQGKLGIDYTQNEHRRAIGRAQSLVEHLLQMLYDKAIGCNIIVTSHITYVKDQESSEMLGGEDYPKKGYPSALGVALSPRIPRYFNSVLYTKSVGSGTAAKQRIYTRTQGVVNVKSSAPLSVKPEYSIETGLAEYFKDVRGASPPEGAGT